MKKILITSSVLLLFVGGFMLNSNKSIYSNREKSNLKEVLKYQVPGGKKAAGISEFFGAIRNNIETGTVSIEEYTNGLNAMNNMSMKRAVNSVWSELGPDNVGGRTRAFLQDKDTPSLMFVGGVSAGLFRSTTRGLSWAPVNDFEANLNISCIAQNTDAVIVYGTGEGQFVSIDGTMRGTPGFQGLGIFRSTNRGRSFQNIASTINFGNISSLAAEKSGGTRIYAATDGGIRYSDDGLTWLLGRNGVCKEVKVASNGHVYAQLINSIQKSSDRGVTWTTISPTGVQFSRASIAISPEDPNYVYFMASAGGTLEGVYRSTDGGISFTKIINRGTPYFEPLGSTASAQGNYNNVLSVNPKNKDHIIMGGVPLAEWKLNNNPTYIASLNEFGGANPSHVHADKHVLQWDETTTPPTLIIGCDGGLFFSSDNLRTFSPKNFGFNATQFYHVAADYEGNVAGGTQDNGTQYINKKGNTKKAAVLIKGGDGYYTEISVKDNSKIFSSTYYGNITRSRDFGKTQSCLWDRRIARSFIGLTDTAKFCEHFHEANYGPFNTKFTLWEHPDFNNQESRLFFARNGQIWMAIGATNMEKEPKWYMIANAQGGSEVWNMEPTRDGNSLFFSNSTTIFRVDGFNSATFDPWSPELSIPVGVTITNLGFNLAGGRSITAVKLDPNDNSKAIITIGNYGGSAARIYRGNDMLGTATFTNISGNIPNIPIYDGLITFSNANTLFVATDLGVFASDNAGASWTPQTNPSNKFPRVATLSLRQFYFPFKSQGSIYAGTHGRGFFECQQYKTNLNPLTINKSFIQLEAYPNPSTEIINIKFKSDVSEIVIVNLTDLNGKIIYTSKVTAVAGENITVIETANIKTGIYIVTINPTKQGSPSRGTVKLVIRH